MIRFARVEADPETAPPFLADLAARGELDWLQLDYSRPALAEAPARGPAELPESPRGFDEAIRAVRPTLFLEPRLRAVS